MSDRCHAPHPCFCGECMLESASKRTDFLLARITQLEAALAAKDQEINRLNTECGHLQADVVELRAAVTVPGDVEEAAKSWSEKAGISEYDISIMAEFILSLAAKGKEGGK